MPNHEQIDAADNKIAPLEAPASNDEQQKQVGAKLLALANFHKRHETVESSYLKALNNNEKLSGNNNERRDLSFLNRLEKMIEKGGSEVEKRLWQRSIANIHIVQPEDITDSTWNSLLQAGLSHGAGYELKSYPEDMKEMQVKQYQDLQKEDLNSFAEYFADENCPYPLWFKIYAWDGLTSLSRNTKVGKDGFPIFQKRDKSTTSGFPKLNPAALAKTYDDIVRHYHLPTDAAEASRVTEETDGICDTLVQGGSFAKIYSYEMSKLSKQVEVPEKTEDIHGEWVEYDATQADELSTAAEGTPWCIVSPNVAKNYLLYGAYSSAKDKKAEEESKGRFLLFHLYEPEKNELAPNACASIRIDPSGKVVEISGLLGGPEQRLHRSLFPIVKEKASQLPNGLKTFDETLDNAELTRLYKMTKDDGCVFSEEDIKYIFESEKRIKPNTYYKPEPEVFEPLPLGVRDYRIDRIKNFILSNPSSMSPSSADEIVEIFDKQGRIGQSELAKNVRTLLSAGADVNKVLDKLSLIDKIADIDILKEKGVDIDAILEETKDLDDKLGTISLVFGRYIDELLRADVDPNFITEKLHPRDAAKHAEQLAAAGADVNKIANNVARIPGLISRYSEQLAHIGIDPNDLLDRVIAKRQQKTS